MLSFNTFIDKIKRIKMIIKPIIQEYRLILNLQNNLSLYYCSIRF
jgi:hypothetical protein